MDSEVVFPRQGADYSDWIENAQAASQVSDSFAVELTAWEAGGFLGAILGGTALLVGLAKYIPGWGPIVSMVGHRVVDMISPKAVAQAHRQERTLTRTAWGMIEAIEDLPSDSPLVKKLKEAITDKTPEEFQSIFAEWKAQNPRPS